MFADDPVAPFTLEKLHLLFQDNFTGMTIKKALQLSRFLMTPMSSTSY